MKRQSGILLPLYSLPSKYGFGTMGSEAYKFIDWLKAAGQSVWQLLPIGPVNDSRSPYQSVSSAAGNPDFIDFEMLAKDGLIDEDDLEKLDEDSLLKKAYGKAKQSEALSASFDSYKESKKDWLFDYALYVSLKENFGGKNWTQWPDEALKAHEAEAVKAWGDKLAESVDFHSFVQFIFASQWSKLRAYADNRGISLIGDIPVYVPLDSADIWAEQQFFLLDENHNPKSVAGVPPDYFNEEGQLWNNPLYDWNVQKADGYGFWIRRIGRTLEYFDIIRIDHFRGFDSFWSVPKEAKSAKDGHWEKGPGFDFVNVICSWFGKEHFIAEDLGQLDDSVRKLLADCGLPGMSVLEFAFDGDANNAYLPHNIQENSIFYLGTHDNNTLAGWMEECPQDFDFAKEYLGLNKEEGYMEGFMRAGMSTRAFLFVAQLQDWLGLGPEARTNMPGTVGKNWSWQLKGDELTEALADKIKNITVRYGR